MEDWGWIGVGLAPVGLGMLIWGLISSSRARSFANMAAHWPTAPGRVFEMGVATGGTVSNPSYEPRARYEYEVGGQRFFGSRIRPGYMSVGSMGQANRMLAPYQANPNVLVRFNPADPNDSCLELTTSSAPLITAIVGAVTLLAAIGVVVWALIANGAGRPPRPATYYPATPSAPAAPSPVAPAMPAPLTPVMPAPMTPSVAPLDARSAQLVGRWSDRPDCSDSVTFGADGIMRGNNGRSTGWSLVGDRLVLQDNPRDSFTIVGGDPDAIQIRFDDGQTAVIRRC